LPRIFDAHVHLSENPQDELIPYAALNGLKYTLEELLGLMRESGIYAGLLLSPPLRGGIPLPNERVLELCRRSGGVLSPVLTVEPNSQSVADSVALAKQSRTEVRGFKIRLGYLKVYADDAVYDPLYAYAESEALPVMFHTGDTASHSGSLVHSHPLTLDRLANQRSGLTIVACHFGNPWIPDVAELIYKHPNVYADISGLVVGGSRYAEEYLGSMAEQLTRAIYYAGGAEKVIFGTDYPVSTPALALNLVSMIKVDPDDQERILWKNAARVFRS
jgi:predicted TIM-barrel fold metal-dependent hydrolase